MFDAQRRLFIKGSVNLQRISTMARVSSGLKQYGLPKVANDRQMRCKVEFCDIGKDISDLKVSYRSRIKTTHQLIDVFTILDVAFLHNLFNPGCRPNAKQQVHAR